MNINKLFCVLILLSGFRSLAQKTQIPPMLKHFEKDLRAEMLELTPWGQNEKLFTLSDSEAKEDAVVINETRADFLEIPKVSEKQTEVFNYRMYYKRVHINEDKSVQTFNKIYLQVRSEMDLVDLRAHTISATGKVSKEFNEKDMKITEEDGNKYLILAVDGAEKGGEIEYFYLTRRGVQEYGNITVQGKTLIREYKYTMRVPENVEFLFKGYNGCPETKMENKGDYNSYTLSASNVPVLNTETFQSFDAELMRTEFVLAYIKSKGRVRLNTYADFSKNEYKDIMDKQKESLKDIKKLSKTLKLEDLTDNETKIRTIENWVKSNIVYAEDLGFSTVSNIIKNKYAGESGLLRLYTYMFEQNEIPYQIWVTCDNSKKMFDEDFESYNFLQEYYFYFPKIKKFLDPKNLISRLGIPPASILGQKALQIKVVDLGNGVTSSKYSIGKATTPSCNLTNAIMKLDISLDAEMNTAKIKYHSEENGYENFVKAIYTLTTDEAKRKESLEEQVKLVSKDAVVTNLKVKNHNLNNIETYEKPVIIDADLAITKIIENAGSKTILKVGELIGQQSELYSPKPRQTRIIDRYPHMYSRTLTVHVPDGFTVKGLDKFVINNVFKNDNGESTDSIGFVCNYVLDGNTVTITCTEYYEVSVWPIAKYEQYRTVINSAADFNKLSLLFDPKK